MGYRKCALNKPNVPIPGQQVRTNAPGLYTLKIVLLDGT
jgi:hypothetical protein